MNSPPPYARESGSDARGSEYFHTRKTYGKYIRRRKVASEVRFLRRSRTLRSRRGTVLRGGMDTHVLTVNHKQQSICSINPLHRKRMSLEILQDCDVISNFNPGYTDVPPETLESFGAGASRMPAPRVPDGGSFPGVLPGRIPGCDGVFIGAVRGADRGVLLQVRIQLGAVQQRDEGTSL